MVRHRSVEYYQSLPVKLQLGSHMSGRARLPVGPMGHLVRSDYHISFDLTSLGTCTTGSKDQTPKDTQGFTTKAQEKTDFKARSETKIS